MRRAFNFEQWIDNNQQFLQPPVANRHLFDETTDMVVMVIGGPNQRTDFHDDPVGEFFYQIRGSMTLKIIEDAKPVDVRISAGEVFYLPPHVRHSPQRPEPGSVGLVVEGNRQATERDGFEWYCFACNERVHRVELVIKDIVKDLPPLFEAFYNDEGARRCDGCGELHPGKIPPAGWLGTAND